VLSFPIPDAIPRNAIVQGAQLTLVQLPSNDSATIPGFGDRGLGFFFLDPTPHNLPSNNVVFQEVTLGAPDNVVSSDFFAPATSGFVALSFTGNVLGNDASAGPRLADVGPGVQRAVSAPGPRFYQVRLQCAKEVWNNQATSEFASVSTSVSSSAGGTASGAPEFNPVGGIVVQVTGSALAQNNTTYQVNAGDTVTVTATLFATNPITVSFSAAGSTFSTFLPTSSTTTSLTVSAGSLGITVITGGPAGGVGATVSTALVLFPANLTQIILSQTFSYTASFSTSFSISTSVAGTPANAAGFEISQGATGTCRAEFDKEPATGTGAGPITTARGPRLDITFTVPR
jgi:plastocyanin